MTTKDSQLTTKKKKRPSKVELVRLDKLEALIADARIAEVEAEAARASAVAEAAALREAVGALLSTLDLNDESRFYHVPAWKLLELELYESPSPAVAALEAELERLRALEALVPEARLLRRLADDAATVADEAKGISVVVELQARADAGTCRILAARIEEARGKERE